MLEEDDAGAVARMLTYLYTLDYEDGSSSSVVVPGSGSANRDPKAIGDNIEASASDSESHKAVSVTTEKTHSTDHEDSSTVPNNHPFAQTMADALRNNIQVYALAEKYHIPELKLLAKSKFVGQVDSLLHVGNYPDIIKLVYESTPSSDRGLRDVITLACSGVIRKMLGEPVFDTLLRDIGDFGIDVLCAALKTDDERLDQMLASKTALQDELTKVRSRLTHVERTSDVYKTSYERSVRVVNAYKNCRHCDAEFAGCLKEDEAGVLRCAKCRTKHM